MKNKKRVILHIGMTKTGTTSLQEYFRDNIDEMAAHGIGFYLPQILPDISLSNARFLCQASSCEARGECLHNSDYTREMNALSLYAKDFETLILSEELMWEKGIEEPEFWKVVKNNILLSVGDDATIDIVVFMRRQDDWILSRWKEYLFNSVFEESMDFPEYLCTMKEKGFTDYKSALDVIAHTFGKSHMIVCKYDTRADSEFDTVKIFLTETGLNIENPAPAIIRKNPSIGMRAAKALLVINNSEKKYNVPKRNVMRATRLFARMFPEEQSYFQMNKADRTTFMCSHEEINKAIFTRYNNGTEFFSKDIDYYCEWHDNPEQALADAELIIKLASLSDETSTFFWRTIKGRLSDDKRSS